MPLTALAPLAAGASLFDARGVFIVLVVAWAAGRLAERMNLPAVLGELVAGFVLGPALLGAIEPSETLTQIGEFGVLVMLLAIGLHVDREAIKEAAAEGVLAATGAMVFPLVGSTAVLLAFGQDFTPSLFVGIALGVTSLATKSRILADLGLLRSRIASVLVAGALVSDVAALVIFAALFAVVAATGPVLPAIAIVLVEVTLFLVVAGGVAQFILPRLVQRISIGGTVPISAGLSTLLGVGLAFAAAAEFAGISGILGAFVAGVVLRAAGVDAKEWKPSVATLEIFTMRALAPVFFVTAAFAVSPDELRANPALLAIVIFMAASMKIIGTTVGVRLAGTRVRTGVTLGFGMMGGGAVEIIVAGIGLERGVIDETLFSILVVTAIVTTIAVPLTFPPAVNWLRARGDLGHEEAGRRGIVVLSAGPLARLLARNLDPRERIVLLDRNPRHVEAARASGLRAVNGDALDPDAQADAGAEDARLLLGLTSNTEANVLAAQVAHELHGVPESHVALGAVDEPIRALAARSNARPWLDVPVDVDAWDHRVAIGTVEARWLDVTDDVGRMHERLRTSDRDLPLVVRRDDEIVPFAGVEALHLGDSVLVATQASPRSGNQDQAAHFAGAAPLPDG